LKPGCSLWENDCSGRPNAESGPSRKTAPLVHVAGSVASVDCADTSVAPPEEVRARKRSVAVPVGESTAIQ
jgi:hypothetical protein